MKYYFIQYGDSHSGLGHCWIKSASREAAMLQFYAEYPKLNILSCSYED